MDRTTDRSLNLTFDEDCTRCDKGLVSFNHQHGHVMRVLCTCVKSVPANDVETYSKPEPVVSSNVDTARRIALKVRERMVHQNTCGDAWVGKVAFESALEVLNERKE